MDGEDGWDGGGGGGEMEVRWGREAWQATPHKDATRRHWIKLCLTCFGQNVSVDNSPSHRRDIPTKFPKLKARW